MAFSLKYDSTELNNSTYNPRIVSYNTTPEKRLSLMELTQKHGVAIVSDLWGQKIIEIQGVLIGSSVTDLEDKIDTLNELFSRKDKNLDITPDGGTARRYVCRLAEQIVYARDYYHLTFVPYTARFLVPASFGKSTSETHNVDTNDIVAVREPAADTSMMTFYGSAPPEPRIVFTIDTLGQLSVLKFHNSGGSEDVYIDGPFAAADVIEINTENMVVTKNGTRIPYRGSIPVTYTLYPGSNVTYYLEFLGNSYTQDQIQTTDHGTGSVVGNNNAGTVRSLAQSFVPSESGYFKQIALWAMKTGAPGNLQVRVFTDNGGKPGAGVAGGSILIAAADVTADAGGGEVTKQNANAVADIRFLTAGVTYWLVITTTNSAGNYYTVYGDATDVYASGFCMKAETTSPTSSDWVDFTATISDLYFKTYYGLGAAADWNVDFDVYYTIKYL